MICKHLFDPAEICCCFAQLYQPVDVAHFGQPWNQQHRSGRVYYVSGYGSLPRLPGAGTGEAKHSSRHAAKTDIARPQGAVLRQALTLLGEVRFMAWHLKRHILGEYWQGLRHFGECRACLGYGPAPVPT